MNLNVTTTNRIDALRRLTRKRLEDQTFVPLSPGRISRTGEIELCYGAALATSAVELNFGILAAKAVANFLATDGTKEDIVVIAAEHGVPRSITLKAIATNDGYPDNERRERVLIDI